MVRGLIQRGRPCRPYRPVRLRPIRPVRRRPTRGRSARARLACVRRPRPDGAPRRPAVASALALAASAFAGCQSYVPRPLDPAAHRDAWHARTLEAGSLEAFLERLERGAEAEENAFDPRDGVNLDEARLVALVFNPELRLARLRAERSARSAEHAGRWPDPELSLSVLRITESVPDRWVVTPALGFTIPLSGRLAAERDRADAASVAALERAREAEWSVLRALAAAWIEWSALRQRAAETERLVQALDVLVRTSADLARRGELPSTEATLFAVEQAQQRNRLLRLSGEVDAGEQALRSLMGLAPEAPLALQPSLTPRADAAPDEATPARLAERNPSLARLRAEYAVAEETLRREVNKQVPDLALGPQFESDEGQSRIGLVAGIPLPVLEREPTRDRGGPCGPGAGAGGVRGHLRVPRRAAGGGAGPGSGAPRPARRARGGARAPDRRSARGRHAAAAAR